MLAKLSGQQSGGRVYHREQNTGSGGHIHGDAEDHACRRAAQRTARTAEYEQDEHREGSADRERVKQQEVVHTHEQTREQKHRRYIAADLGIGRARLLRAQQVVKAVSRSRTEDQKQRHARYQQQ